MYLQQFTGMQSSKRGIRKGYHLSIERIRKRNLFREKCYRTEGNGLDGADLPVYPPPVPGPVPCEQSLRLSLGSFKQQLQLREQ